MPMTNMEYGQHLIAIEKAEREVAGPGHLSVKEALTAFRSVLNDHMKLMLEKNPDLDFFKLGKSRCPECESTVIVLERNWEPEYRDDFPADDPRHNQPQGLHTQLWFCSSCGSHFLDHQDISALTMVTALTTIDQQREAFEQLVAAAHSRI